MKPKSKPKHNNLIILESDGIVEKLPDGLHISEQPLPTFRVVLQF
jgi:hypothetical protein